jgi:hypothetical protein
MLSASKSRAVKKGECCDEPVQYADNVDLCESLPPVRMIQYGCILNICFRTGSWTVSHPINAVSLQFKPSILSVNSGRQFRGWTAHSPRLRMNSNQSKSVNSKLRAVNRWHPTQPHHQSTVLSKAHHTNAKKKRPLDSTSYKGVRGCLQSLQLSAHPSVTKKKLLSSHSLATMNKAELLTQ